MLNKLIKRVFLSLIPKLKLGNEWKRVTKRVGGVLGMMDRKILIDGRL